MPNIPVFYTPKMVADSGSASPSAAKPAQVVESWKRQFPVDIIEPLPVTVDEIVRAHKRQFVEDILACRADNGFENRSSAVAQALPYTSGSMLSAARHVLVDKGVAAAPCSGFHHAEWDKAMGYCTFNGLMITALALKEDVVQYDDTKEKFTLEHVTRRIGILDLDMHYGNGTDDILIQVNQEGWCRHFTAGDQFRSAAQVPKFFDQWLPRVLDKLSDCGLVLYQAGADPHIKDPHGGWLTTPELKERDAHVFEFFRAHKIPLVWNLAGGYQVEKDGSIPKVLEIHDNTMRECVRVWG
jgi:acetoin utilization deacetylase AcuC-like enzyme